MKTQLRILIGIAIGMLIFISCKDEPKVPDSKVILDTVSFSGFTGEAIKVNLSTEGEGFSKIVVTKWRNGQQEPGYELVISSAEFANGYQFNQEIEVGDEEGTLVYRFSGYNSANELLDATDLVVSVTLTDFGRLVKFDWKLVEQTTNGDNTMEDVMKDNVYRLNSDFSWQYDWGNPEGAGLDVLNQYCAWKYIGTEMKGDSLYLVKYGFLSTDPTIEKYKIVKLDDDNLWIQTFLDLSWLGDPYTTETPVIEKFVAVPKSKDFTPYRGEEAGNYSWAPCQPGSY